MFHLNYEYKQPTTLFTTENAKTTKGEELGFKTFIIYMSPHKQNSMGKNICPNATPGCSASCLFTAGMGKFSTVKVGRLNKTEFFLRDKNNFMNQMVKELEKGYKKYGKNLVVRLNGTSDIPYENIAVGGKKNIMELFPDVQFYDYTKIFSRLLKELPTNYHLTFSRAETAMNQREAELALSLGFNVAMVFAVKDETQLPSEYNGYKVVNGDMHDLTFLHGNGVILGLKAKGDAKKDKSGFVVRKFSPQLAW